MYWKYLRLPNDKTWESKTCAFKPAEVPCQCGMTHDTREWKREFDEKFEKGKFSTDYLDSCNRFHIDPNLIKSFIHQQLQKARQDWLREEIVRLKIAKLPEIKSDDAEWLCPECGFFNEDATDYNQALQTIIDRYYSELDQLSPDLVSIEKPIDTKGIRCSCSKRLSECPARNTPEHQVGGRGTDGSMMGRPPLKEVL